MRGLFFALAVAVGMCLSGCKTTEANYRAAYQTAVAKRDSVGGVDSTIYSKIRRDATMSMLVIGKDSLPMRTEYIGYTEGGGATRSMLKRYNVVAGQFKQLFNAMQMRRRLIDNGYSDAFVIHTREPLYYVCTSTSSVPDSAAAAFDRIATDTRFRLIAPAPFIVRPAHLAR